MSQISIITGSNGLIGSTATHYFHEKGFHIVGIDNDMRSQFFGESSSTKWCRNQLIQELDNYHHYDIDIRDNNALEKVFTKYNHEIKLIIHAAAQPSHDWAAQDPITDFTINANGTLLLLENTRKHCPDATFVYVSTNKVYGDTPNQLDFIETDTRWELKHNHPYYDGIDEKMSIDQSLHSLFGASKTSADLLVQEYGRYFGVHTGCFRGGCLTGPRHSGAELHGFLSFLVYCAITEKPYTIFGHKGKQVRDNIHSYDVVNAFYHFHQNPRAGEVYNLGGGRHSNCSLLEAITKVEQVTGKKLSYTYANETRIGDHIWWISSMNKFQEHYPDWSYKYNLEDIITQIYQELTYRLSKQLAFKK